MFWTCVEQRTTESPALRRFTEQDDSGGPTLLVLWTPGRPTRGRTASTSKSDAITTLAFRVLGLPTPVNVRPALPNAAIASELTECSTS